ncbi:hypothetical protein DIZ76_012611 [Coccidioides immitis]|uniref:DUF202 domain-containing protein n=2 Tax=Coccidioides immitis TaxID=5501 RepID=A0A0J8QXN2_COCIT|nr:hypothetical protein CIRG_02515 [Coccidioides immitis RMSCC 2394]KMU77211.1 hypothetical protein CISG_06055 [Coccidioides immitis RMSCC 3703]TPX23284.1 hypothetical protein DIZ76_012611 [Coccidioides immitis]
MPLNPVLTSIANTYDNNADSNPRRSTDSYSSIETLSHPRKPLQGNSSRSSSSGFSSTSSPRRSPLHERAPIIAGTPPRHYQSTDNVTAYPSDPNDQQTDNQQRSQAHRTKSPSGSMDSHCTFGDGHPWYKRVLDKYGSLELDNKGSVARDHLALERTFLAWLRTSLAFASIGIAITQLFRLNTSIQQQTPAPASASSISSHFPPPVISDEYQANDYNSIGLVEESRRLRSLGKPLGATFIGVAIIVLVIGFHRYFQGQYWVVRGKFPASRGSVAVIAFIAGALMVSSLVVILAIAPGAIES